jgi:hypothetical protein
MNLTLSDTDRQRALDFINYYPIGELTTLEQAQLLFALNDSAATQHLRQQLVGRLRLCLRAEWFQQTDLTTIFMTMSALSRHQPDLIDGKLIAHAAQRLVASETAVGGPYANQGESVELSVQLAIALCMQQLGTMLPKVLAVIKKEIRPHSFMAQGAGGYLRAWYAASLTDPDVRQLITEQLLRHRVDGKWGSFTATLLARLILDNTQPEAVSTSTLSSLSTEQLPDGSWEAGSLPEFSAAGGRLFVTILMVQQPLRYTKKGPSAYDREALQIIQACQRKLNRLSAPLSATSKEMLQEVAKVDAEHEITLLPYFFNQALQTPLATIDQLRLLGQANVFAWMAYVIYDDFLDDEGDPRLLSTANVAHRFALSCYDQIVEHDAVQLDWVDSIFTELDAANAWEIANCRFNVSDNCITIRQIPDFGDRDILAQRTAIHTLGAQIILYQHGLSPESVKGRQIKQAYRHYLIARQLNDDVHDWLKDLQAGQISYVVAVILHKMELSRGEAKLDKLLQQARHVFWQEALPEIAQTALEHILLSRQLFETSGLLRRTNAIYDFLDNMATVMRDGLAKRQQGLDFLTVFSRDPSID